MLPFKWGVQEKVLRLMTSARTSAIWISSTSNSFLDQLSLCIYQKQSCLLVCNPLFMRQQLSVSTNWFRKHVNPYSGGYSKTKKKRVARLKKTTSKVLHVEYYYTIHSFIESMLAAKVKEEKILYFGAQQLKSAQSAFGIYEQFHPNVCRCRNPWIIPTNSKVLSSTRTWSPRLHHPGRRLLGIHSLCCWFCFFEYMEIQHNNSSLPAPFKYILS